jgi:TolC family type I secretion outer membrane protein
MITFKQIACFLAVLSAILCSGSVYGEKQTIQQSLRIAEDNNPGLSIARENITRTQAVTDLGSAEGLPNISLDWTYTRSHPQLFTNDFGPPLLITPRSGTMVELSLSQRLDLLGIANLGRRMAHLGAEQARHDFETARNNLRYEVKKAYFDVLHAEDDLCVRERSLAQLSAHLDDANTNFKAGTIARFDVVRAQTQVSNAKVDLIVARNRVRMSKASFNSILGRDLSAPVELEIPELPKYVEPDLAACIAAASSSRPEVESATAQAELARGMVSMAGQGNSPTVEVALNGTRNFTPTLENTLTSVSSAGISADLPIYDAGLTRSAVGQARSDALSANSGLRMAILGVSLDVRQAFLALREARQSIVAAGSNLDLAKEGLRLADVAYRGGATTQLDVLDAQNALTQADFSYADALYNYHLAEAKLEQAVGGEEQMKKLQAK